MSFDYVEPVVRGILALKILQVQLLIASYLFLPSPLTSLHNFTKMPRKMPRWTYIEDSMAKAILDISDKKLSVI